MRPIAMFTVVLIAAFLAACSGTGSTPAKTGPASAQPAPAAVTSSPPALSPVEGTWRSGRLTEPEFVRWYRAAGGGTSGSVPETGQAFFRQLGGGTHRYSVITLRFRSGYFAQFESGDGRPAVPGYSATYRVSGARTLILVSLDPDPTVCTGVYAFTIRGSQLRLHVRKQCAEGHDGPFNTTLFASFPFTKVA